ncbi:hypothetical protein K435DRAFT_966058 [Dendrothele bispora CBS 962.96]|uniref:Uncharacterized protein n=1 Tax=Dendrothele bispora (strain CBS 962.96) TaxID=1314807 RepID=A0A4S8M287_DENBC|nr:hypothetical protein K435DRAFT_966058 [Dendrothele bispora CBS 962.96]
MTSSPLVLHQTPSTPRSDRSSLYHKKSYTPLNSSPLATSSPTYPSPISEAQARRKFQYKSRTSSSSLTDLPIYSRQFDTNSGDRSSPLALWAGYSAGVAAQSETHALLRDKFKYKCLERAQKARRRAVNNKRRLQSGSDDVFMEDDMDEEDTDEQLMSNEFYRRVMTNSNRQDARRRLRTYYDECGSSFDPDLEDVGEWEHELDDSHPSLPSSQMSPNNEDLTPEQRDDAELEAYAQEYETQAALADFEDIPLDELLAPDGFSEDDFEEQDVEMHL